MAEEKTRFGEQAINKIAEVALARQLKDVKQFRVRIKSDLSRLARGEVESIELVLMNLWLQQNLLVEMLQLQITEVAVKPLSALRGKIQLVQPAQGSLNLIINQDALIDALNCTTFRERFYQRLDNKEEKALNLGQVQYSVLSKDSIEFSVVIANGSEAANKVTFTVTPAIRRDGEAIELNILRPPNRKVPGKFIDALLAQISDVLSLQEFARQGMYLHLQQFQVAEGKLTLQAVARIEQFPSS